VVSPRPTRPLVNGVTRSGANTRGVSRNAKGRAGTDGSSTKCSSASRTNVGTCDAPSTKMATSSIVWFRNAKKLAPLDVSYPKLLCSQTKSPIEITTDKLRSFTPAKRDVMPSVAHCHDQYPNNRAEVSHEPTREQERQMRGLSSDGHAQQLLSVHGQVNNLFRLGRHLLRASNYRELRSRAFRTWTQATCVQ
jgi:hypothetical protein